MATAHERNVPVQHSSVCSPARSAWPRPGPPPGRRRNGCLTSNDRTPVAGAMMRVLDDRSSADLRLQAALALAEFTEVDGVAGSLGRLALDADEPIDLRYSAFTSLERTGPTSECA